MSAISQDRRSRRSRRLLKQGLLELMQEKRFSDISVRDITDRMDLNRSTFYLHYPDTLALLESLEEDLLQDIQTVIDEHVPETSGGTLRPIFEPIQDYIVKNRELCHTLFVNNATSNFVDQVHALIARNGAQLIQRWAPGLDKARLEYLLGFLSYGLVGMIQVWFAADDPLPSGQLVELVDRLAVSAVRSMLEQHEQTP